MEVTQSHHEVREQESEKQPEKTTYNMTLVAWLCQNCRDGQRLVVRKNYEGKGMVSGSSGYSFVFVILYDTIIIDMYHYTLVQ